jgi:Protein of unknown function (DUF2809)
MKNIKTNYLFISIAILIVEIVIALFVNDEFIRPIFGDYLAVILLFYLFATFLKISKTKIAVITLLISYIIEGLQYIHILELLNLERYTLLKIVFGTSFSWMDMIAYTFGTLTVLLIHNYTKIKS